jgi:hypothetical protein
LHKIQGVGKSNSGKRKPTTTMKSINWKSAPAKKFLVLKAKLEAAAKLSGPREWGKPYMSCDYEETTYSVSLFVCVTGSSLGDGSQRLLSARLRAFDRTSLVLQDWMEGDKPSSDTTGFWLEFERYMDRVSA